VATTKSKSRAEAPPVGQTELASLTMRIIEAVRPHAKAIAIVSIGVVLIVAGLSIWTGLERRKAGNATKAFTDVVAKLNAPVEEAGPQLDLSDPSNPQLAAKKADYKTFADRDQAALDEVSKLEGAYKGKVATDARIVQAGLLYDAGKYDEAIAAYKDFLTASPPPELGARAREGIGYALEAKALAQTDAAARNAGLDEAQRAFAQIEADEKGPFMGLALYHRARIAQLKGDKAGAVSLYKQAAEKLTGSALAEEVKGRLDLLEAK
jgi:hypothetical protein